MLNVDIGPRSSAYVDVTRLLPFPDGSFDRIFCEGVLEHVNMNSGLQLVSECYRILRPSGIIRLMTPSLEHFASRVGGKREINTIFYGQKHRYIYSTKELTEQRKSSGFNNMCLSSDRDSNFVLGTYDFHADRFAHRPEISHYDEASKP